MLIFYGALHNFRLLAKILGIVAARALSLCGLGYYIYSDSSSRKVAIEP